MTIKAKEEEMNAQLQEQQSNENDIVDIELKEIQKKRFRLDRDNNRVIELNTSDLSIVSRLEQIYPKLLAFVDEAQVANKRDDAEENLIAINDKMKELIDWAFDSEVCDKACPSGTLYDPINGKFRFEYIMERLLGLYNANLNNEFNLMKKRVSKHTAKYTKKRK